jgi:DNA gyrase subunit A
MKEFKSEDKNIARVSMQDVMHNSMMPYAEYIIMERALPRVEDGLKPVQRRILYTMLELSITPDKPHRKSARIVGDTMGKYHPHGDSSIYDAMVRMSQDYNMRVPLVDGHGNFGSIDGDSAAAMRYTEARLTPIAMEMLAYIEKDTVPFKLNFDDSMKEPVMLPARFPNLLVNGSTGIAIGLATNIPPHNLGEVIDGVIARIKNKRMSLDELMQIIKAPDFPTGGYLLNMDELKQAYETGKGKIRLRAKTHIENGSNGKKKIVITQIPYQVNKSSMLEKILKVSEQRKVMFSGISDIRDESDRTGIRAVVELKKGADANNMLNCLYKYTDLQTTFGINMVAIADGVPKQLSLLEIIDHYVKYQKQVVTKRTQHDLENAERREHILAGLIIAVNNIDEVIKIIRGSDSPKEAKIKLKERFELSSVQAQAILDMRLARLTALEIITLESEYAQIIKIIKSLKTILSSETKLLNLIVKELLDIKEDNADNRRTEILSENAEVVIDTSDFEVIEDCVVVLTRSGVIKKMSVKAFKKGMETGSKDEANAPLTVLATKSNRLIRCFTDAGNMYSINAMDIPESRWREKGRAINTLLLGVLKSESIIGIYDFSDYKDSDTIVFVTNTGMIKRSNLGEYKTKNSKLLACGLKEKTSIVSINILNEDRNLLIVTKMGMSIRISLDEVSVMGRSAKGVKGISLDKNDLVAFAFLVNGKGDICLISDYGFSKMTEISEFETQGRAGKGLKAMNFMPGAKNGNEIKVAFYITEPTIFKILMKSGDFERLSTTDIIRDKRNTKGEQAVNVVLGNTVEKGFC